MFAEKREPGGLVISPGARAPDPTPRGSAPGSPPGLRPWPPTCVVAASLLAAPLVAAPLVAAPLVAAPLVAASLLAAPLVAASASRWRAWPLIRVTNLIVKSFSGQYPDL
ncbi:hypothetical protein Ate02nite_15310 [Paractinoplanes tereljensis]|uniref:Uncharacterized protein n=1 Tax=Paractinoplanes tereljensis TaxID=571912 RepID=A0A919TQX9_9ACTN|nr:hypothetical protein Ate02nite_15310 [Actinoplanes tereljensis]